MDELPLPLRPELHKGLIESYAVEAIGEIMREQEDEPKEKVLIFLVDDDE